jgi:glyoxylase-like metal-dependent hydrolase (beta-lactamase superfamily II)
MARDLKGGVVIFEGHVSNPYLVCGPRLFAVDAATVSAAKQILSYIDKRLKRPPEDLDFVTATHFHFDHIAGLDYLCKATGAKVAFHRRVRRYLCEGKKIPFPPLKRWAQGLWRSARRGSVPLPSIHDVLSAPTAGLPLVKNHIESPVGFWLEDDEMLPGSEAWKVVFTPGHSEDSACFYNEKEKVLVSGDTVVNYHGSGELNPFHDDSWALALSFRRLRELDVRHLYPGHGFPLGREDGL